MAVIGSDVVDVLNVDLQSGALSTGAVPTNNARKGSLFINTNPSSGARIFINTTGSSTWTAITTAA